MSKYVEHELKCWPRYYDAVEAGRKTFEARKDDRAIKYQEGHYVTLVRTEGETSVVDRYPYSQEPRYKLRFRIGHVLRGPGFGVEEGWCILSLLPVEATE